MGRWLFVGLTMVGMLCWWWPSYRSWGALSGGLVVVLGLWLCSKVLVGERTVPGHPIHLAFLLPVCVLLGHIANGGLSNDPAQFNSISCSLTISLLFAFGLLSLGIMLIQGLLPHAADHGVLISISGAAIMAGSLAATLVSGTEPVRGAMTMIGWAGAAVWLSPLWDSPGISRPDSGHSLGRIELKTIRIGVALIGVCLLFVRSPAASFEALLVGAIVLVMASVVCRRRWRYVLVSIGVTMSAAFGAWFFGGFGGVGRLIGSGIFGCGDIALAEVSGRDSVFSFLWAVIGWPATLWLVLGGVVCIARFLTLARWSSAHVQWRSVVWSAAAAMAGVGLLCRGGLFVPAIVLVVAFVWGLMPAVRGGQSRQRPGIILLVLFAVGLVVQGLVKSQSLLMSSVAAFPGLGHADKLAHACVGGVLAMLMAWMAGARNMWWGLAGIAAAAAVGGAGELIQVAVGTRGAEYDDWFAHMLGCAVVTVPYVLCMGARLCESAEARELGNPEDDRYAEY